MRMREKKEKEGKEKRKRKKGMKQFSVSLVLVQSIFDAINRVFPLTFPFSFRWSVKSQNNRSLMIYFSLCHP